MLDEAALRKPEWAEGVPIVLGDEQAWMFPKPILRAVRFRPVEKPDGTFDFGYARPTFEGDYDARVDAYLESPDGTAEAVALLNLAVDLLRRNYALDAAAIAVLLPIVNTPDAEAVVRDEANAEMWRAIADVAMGRAEKKATGTGSDAASGSSASSAT